MALSISFALAAWLPLEARPAEHVAVQSGAVVTFAAGTGHADPHAEAYFDVAMPAAWLAGFAAGLGSSTNDAPAPTLLPLAAERALLRAWDAGRAAAAAGSLAPAELLAASAASLRGHVLREAEPQRRGDFDVVSFKLRGTRVDLAVLSLAAEGTHSALRYAILGDIALHRLRDGVLERFARGGTFGEDDDERRAAGLPPELADDAREVIGGIQCGCIGGADGAVRGQVRVGTIDVAGGDRFALTSRALHRSPEVSPTMLAAAMAEGQGALDALCAVIAASESTRSSPSAALIEVG